MGVSAIRVPRPAADADAEGASARLVLRGLTKRYGELVALDDCQLVVQAGRVVGLLGPNGAGKTTTMRCIFGLVEPDAGAVSWAGEAVTGEARLRFGYMPEERGLYAQMRVRDQLEYFARLSGLDAPTARARVAAWLDRLGLADRGEDRVAALSHGNQQRVQLAAALVHDPVLLVLDEPFSGLDPLGVESLSAVIGELAASGTAVLFSSHQLDLVEDVCDDVVVIDHGRVVMQGDLEQLRASAPLRYLDVVFRGPQVWEPRVDGGSVLAAEPGHTRVALTAGAELAGLAAEAEAAGEVVRFGLAPPNLSDLFHEAVGR